MNGCLLAVIFVVCWIILGLVLNLTKDSEKNSVEAIIDLLVDGEVTLACDMRNDAASVECYFDRWR